MADFTPEAAARVLSKSPFDPMMRTSPSATSTRWASAPKVVASVAAALDPDPLPRGPGELLDHRGRDRLLPCALRHRLGTLGVYLGLIADCLQASDALLQRRIVQVGDAGFGGFVILAKA